MRTIPVIISAAGLGLAALLAGGVYHHLATSNARVGTSAATVPSLAVETATSGGAFSIHEEPKPIPELRFVNGAGRDMTLEDFDGKTVLLNIWATWCVPCRKEMPALDRLQAELGGPDFEVVPVSIDRAGLPAVEAFYQELGLEALGIYVDQSASAAYELGAVGLPTTLLVNPKGQERGRLVGPAEWDSPEMMALVRQQLKVPDIANAN